MSERLSAEGLTAIRERAERYYATSNGEPPYEVFENVGDPEDDVQALLAHLDAITEAVEGLPVVEYASSPTSFAYSDGLDRDAVLAILRGRG